jgi:hypothetical protein
LTGPLTVSAVWLLGAFTPLSLFSMAFIVADEDVFLQFKAVLRIRDVCPGSRILIFTHPGSRIQKQQQKRGVKKNFCHTFYVATNFTKFKIILVWKCRRKKFGPIFKEF